MPRSKRLIEEAINDNDFYLSYCDDDKSEALDVPLWWKRDVPVKLTQRERLKEIKRQNAVNAYMSGQLKIIKKQNEEYANKSEQKELKFKAELENNRYLTELKLNEIELAANENAEILTKELLQKEEELRSVLREKMQAEAIFNHEEQIKLKKQAVKNRLDELSNRLNVTTSVLESEKRALETLREKTDELRETNIVKENEIVQKTEKCYEEFDKCNVVELRDLYFKQKNKKDLIFGGVNIFIKREKISIIYSDKNEKLDYIKQILYNNFSDDFSITKGLVRIEGQKTSNSDDVNVSDVVDTHLISLADTARKLSQSNLTKSFFKNNFNEKEIKYFSEYFNIPFKVVNSKLTKLNYNTICTIALICLLQSDKSLIILESPEELLNSGVIHNLINLFNSGSLNKSILLMTTSLTLINSISQAKVFKI